MFDYSSNSDFYPTPKKLFYKMYKKVKRWGDIKTILEPSAGSGTLCDFLREELKYYNHEFLVIEKDEVLQKELLKKQYKLIDSDFLTYDNSVECDLIFANFPFSEGDRHLLKAIECLYSGQIVAIINAETIKNPYSKTRKDLVYQLESLNASIEFLENEFVHANRKTKVEVALIYIQKNNDFEKDFSVVLDTDCEEFFDIKQEGELVTSDKVDTLVKLYNKEKELLTKQLLMFYQNYKHVGSFLNISVIGMEDTRLSSDTDLTAIFKQKINQLNHVLKKKYWNLLINEEIIAKNLTSAKKKKLRNTIQRFHDFSFNHNNVQIMVKTILEDFSSSINEAVLELFDEFTKYSLKDSRWSDKEFQSNIHYYNAWKANSAYKINKKVIVNFYKAREVIEEQSIGYDQKNFLIDIHRVIGYFDKNHKEDVSETILKNLRAGKTSKIKVNSLLFTFYKKGTLHIEFTDEEVLRKFNITVGKLRGDLPMDYSEKDYNDLNVHEKNLVKNFDTDIKNYKIYTNNNLKLLTMA